jgi:2-amino-4-hydroxy-6-hydroxymethyldihydropteridine diphosphokinase
METSDLTEVLLSFGSNLGNREALISFAIKELSIKVGEIIMVSDLVETKPEGFESSNDFLNGCLSIKTSLTPYQLLMALKEIENNCGRQQSLNGYSDRPIDLDIILYGNQMYHCDSLIIPHPRFRKRHFVIEPSKSFFQWIDPKTYLFLEQFHVK